MTANGVRGFHKELDVLQYLTIFKITEGKNNIPRNYIINKGMAAKVGTDLAPEEFSWNILYYYIYNYN